MFVATPLATLFATSTFTIAPALAEPTIVVQTVATSALADPVIVIQTVVAPALSDLVVVIQQSQLQHLSI